MADRRAFARVLRELKQGEPLGTLNLYRRDRHAWTDAETARAREVAGVVTGLLRVAEERSVLAARSPGWNAPWPGGTRRPAATTRRRATAWPACRR
jgi:hypothetical protein